MGERLERPAGITDPQRLADLVTMKLSALADRGARRDFWDLHELLLQHAISLPQALDLQRQRYPNYDLGS